MQEFSEAVIQQSQLIARNYKRITGRSLTLVTDPEKLARQLYEAPFVVLSHGTEADPLFNYVNLKAQQLWEMSWEEMVGMPSRKSAEPEAEEDRRRMLEEAARNGYIDNYQGIRIAQSGRRFRIKNVLLMNLQDERQAYCGQSAVFSEWKNITG